MKFAFTILVIVLSASAFAAAPVNRGPLTEWGYTNQIHGRAGAIALLTNAVQASADETWSLALRSDGSLFGWGQNAYAQTNVPAGTNYVYSDAGWRHGLAISNNGGMVEWSDYITNWTTAKPNLNNVWKVNGADLHSVALTSNNIAYFWGQRTAVTSHAAVSNCVDIATTWYHTICLLADGTISIVGQDVGGNAGHYVAPPFTITNAVNIGAGIFASYAIISNATTPRQLIAWGTSNFWGELDIPAQYATNVVYVTGGHRHTYWLTSDGATHAVGDNTYGQTNIPASLATADLIYSGSFHAGGIKSDIIPIPVTHWTSLQGNVVISGQVNVTQ